MLAADLVIQGTVLTVDELQPTAEASADVMVLRPIAHRAPNSPTDGRVLVVARSDHV